MKGTRLLHVWRVQGCYLGDGGHGVVTLEIKCAGLLPWRLGAWFVTM